MSDPPLDCVTTSISVTDEILVLSHSRWLILVQYMEELIGIGSEWNGREECDSKDHGKRMDVMLCERKTEDL